MLLRIELKPLEPYFFGNERSLKYEAAGDKFNMKASSYFAKSEATPLQSTLFGALRYMGIKEKHSDFKLTEADYENIGRESFQLDSQGQTFGKIRSISNIFLTDSDGSIYIKAPADQPEFSGSADKENKYCGFKEFIANPVQTHNGIRYLPKADMKKGFFDGYVRVKDGVCVSSDEIFTTIIRTGIDTKGKDEAYFKKAYCFMKDYSFMFYADVEESFPEIKDIIVNLGQGKTAFAVTVKKSADIHETGFDISTEFPVEATKVVLLSDSFVRDIKGLYGCCYFSHTDTREYRAMKTVYNAQTQSKRYQKQESLLKLMKAGSVFWVKPECMEEFECLLKDEHAQIAGFNIYITGGNK